MYGKPRIIPETLQVVYRKDIYTTMYFDAVRDQVSPQVSIPQDEYDRLHVDTLSTSIITIIGKIGTRRKKSNFEGAAHS